MSDEKIRRALDDLAAALKGRVAHGRTVAGTLRIDDLDVEITIAAHAVVAGGDRANYTAAAMDLLAREGYRDGCHTSVPNRSPWSVSKTKSCAKPVVAALVFRNYKGDLAFRFTCAHHGAEHHGIDTTAVTATVTLPPAALRVLRAKRKRESEERYAREQAEDRERDRAGKVAP